MIELSWFKGFVNKTEWVSLIPFKLWPNVKLFESRLHYANIENSVCNGTIFISVPAIRTCQEWAKLLKLYIGFIANIAVSKFCQ